MWGGPHRRFPGIVALIYGSLDLSAPGILGDLGHMFGDPSSFLWGAPGRRRARATTSIIPGGCVGTARDVPGHRRVDLRCLRASWRPLRAHLCIREAAVRTRAPPRRDGKSGREALWEGFQVVKFSSKRNFVFFPKYFLDTTGMFSRRLCAVKRSRGALSCRYPR